MNILRKAFTSSAGYPLTATYIAGVVAVITVTEHVLSLLTSVVLLTLIAVTSLVTAVWREVRAVHNMLTIQRNELLGRINKLVQALNEAGVQSPEGEVGNSAIEILFETQVPDNGGGTYTVRIYSKGRGAYCSCPVWRYHTEVLRLRSCPHIMSVVEAHPDIFSDR